MESNIRKFSASKGKQVMRDCGFYEQRDTISINFDSNQVFLQLTVPQIPHNFYFSPSLSE